MLLQRPLGCIHLGGVRRRSQPSARCLSWCAVGAPRLFLALELAKQAILRYDGAGGGLSALLGGGRGARAAPLRGYAAGRGGNSGTGARIPWNSGGPRPSGSSGNRASQRRGRRRKPKPGKELFEARAISRGLNHRTGSHNTEQRPETARHGSAKPPLCGCASSDLGAPAKTRRL